MGLQNPLARFVARRHVIFCRRFTISRKRTAACRSGTSHFIPYCFSALVQVSSIALSLDCQTQESNLRSRVIILPIWFVVETLRGAGIGRKSVKLPSELERQMCCHRLVVFVLTFFFLVVFLRRLFPYFFTSVAYEISYRAHTVRPTAVKHTRRRETVSRAQLTLGFRHLARSSLSRDSCRGIHSFYKEIDYPRP